MFLKCYLFQTFKHFTFSSLLLFLIFRQPLDNLFLTRKTILNWNFYSIATSTVQSFVTKYLRKERGDLNKVVSDNDDDKNDDYDANSKNVDVVEIGTGKALTKPDIAKIWNTYQRKKETFLSP